MYFIKKISASSCGFVINFSFRKLFCEKICIDKARKCGCTIHQNKDSVFVIVRLVSK